MRSVGLGLFLSLVMLGTLLAPAGMAEATRPEPFAATLTITSAVPTSVRVADGNVFLTLASEATLTGDLEGVLTYEVRVIVHPTGRGNLQVTGIFEGTVDGQWGTLVTRGQGTFDSGFQQGQLVMGHGTGDLEGLHMRGTFEGPIGGPLTLLGWMHFDP